MRCKTITVEKIVISDSQVTWGFGVAFCLWLLLPHCSAELLCCAHYMETGACAFLLNNFSFCYIALQNF